MLHKIFVTFLWKMLNFRVDKWQTIVYDIALN